MLQGNFMSKFNLIELYDFIFASEYALASSYHLLLGVNVKLMQHIECYTEIFKQGCLTKNCFPFYIVGI